MGEIEGEAECSLSRAAVTVRGVNGSGSTACGLRCVTEASRKVDAIQVKVGVVEEVGGGCGRRGGWWVWWLPGVAIATLEGFGAVHQNLGATDVAAQPG